MSGFESGLDIFVKKSRVIDRCSLLVCREPAKRKAVSNELVEDVDSGSGCNDCGFDNRL
jgi:hypothetical protein